MLTKERKDLITAYLSTNEEHTKALFNMMPDEAVVQINANGYDFTVDEIREYGENLKRLAEAGDGELNAEDLENVAGGLGTLAILAIYGAVAAGGFGVGVCAYKGWW